MSITLIAMNAQPTQQQGEFKSHNYLVSLINHYHKYCFASPTTIVELQAPVNQ